MQEKNTVTFNIQNFNTIDFNINGQKFSVDYNDETLQELLMIVNGARKAERAYEAIMDKVNDKKNTEEITLAEIKPMFTEFQGSVDEFLNKALGEKQTKKLYDMFNGVFTGRVSTAFNLISDTLQEVANGSDAAHAEQAVKRNQSKRLRNLPNRSERRAKAKNGKVTPLVQPATQD